MENQIGKVYGRLSILKEVASHVTPCGSVKRRFQVQCSCGTTKEVRISDLRSGRTVSCGCHLRDITTVRNTTHGLSKTRLYDIWSGMVKRCTNQNYIDYAEYGGRGILVLDGWLSSFEKFHSDMFDLYYEGATLDRYDVNGNYCKDNCRWTDNKRQSRNRRKTKANSSGKTGVSWQQTKASHTLYAVAIWRTLDGKQGSKSFSTRKYGLLEAFSLACAYRDKMILELNEQGAGYTEHHGK